MARYRLNNNLLVFGIIIIFFIKFYHQRFDYNQRKIEYKLHELKIYEYHLKNKISELEKLHAKLKAKQKEYAVNSLIPQGGLERKIQKYFIFPLKGKISSGFGERVSPFHKDLRFHQGIDIQGKIGEKIISCSNGRVVKISYNSTYGNYLEVQYHDYLFRYAHFSKINVRHGEIIKAGDKIGSVGMTGLATGPHLHFEVYKNGKLKNPLKLFDFN